MKVVVSLQAARDIETAAQWWQANRPKAPGLLREEIRRALAALAVTPGLGAPALDAAAAGIRRVYLKGSRYFLYYSVGEQTVEILRLWHASRGSAPGL